ncbi:helix-turn-helix transcriptional regulator [Sphingobacterium hungaricum]
MLFKLLFHELTNEIQPIAIAAECDSFQVSREQVMHYQSHLADILCRHYQTQNIHHDHYLVANANPDYELSIYTTSEVYSLIAVKHGLIVYSATKKKANSLQISENQCCLLRASKGIYTVCFLHPRSDFKVLSMSAEILQEFKTDFLELCVFIDSMATPGLFSMPICQMDQTFNSRLEQLQSFAAFVRKKDQNRRLLWEIPTVLSAYKGLLRKKDKPSVNQLLVEKIRNYINQKTQKIEPISVELLCAEFPVSKKTLERLFVQHFAEGPARYIRRLKIEHVAILLKTTHISLMELALSFGYSDANALNKAFKKQIGNSLMQHRYNQQSK